MKMFVSALDLTGEIVVDRLTGEGEFIARAPVGYDSIEGTVYSVVVALSPLPGHADIPGYELAFYVAAANDEGDISAYYDGWDTRHLLNEPRLRAMVHSITMMLVEMLVDDIEPPLASIVTHNAGLPFKALTKFTTYVRSSVPKDIWLVKPTSGMASISG